MHLYNLTLQVPSSVDAFAQGNFSGRSKQQELCLARNGVLEIVWPNSETQQLVTLCRTETFANIRSIESFRIPGSGKDYISLGTDSGKLIVLQYNLISNKIEQVADHTFGKWGTLRDTGGQFVTADPRGRAIVVSAVEGQRLLYLLNRDGAGKLIISSPLDFSQKRTLISDFVGLDVKYDNPLFAALEVNYTAVNVVDSESASKNSRPIESANKAIENLKKSLVFYEVDLGLNNIIRRASVEVDMDCNKIIPLPGAPDGPGGVLVCGNGCISWHHPLVADRKSSERPSNLTPKILIPRRSEYLATLETANKGGNNSQNSNKKRKKKDNDVIDDIEEVEYQKTDAEVKKSLGVYREDNGVLITAATTHKMKKTFFTLAQTDEGDMFKVTMSFTKAANGAIDYASGEFVINIKYFDTIPTSTGLSIFKTGYLFSGSEFGSHALYQIDNLGDDDEEQPTFHSTTYAEQLTKCINKAGKLDRQALLASFIFDPRPLRNIHVTHDLQSMNGVTNADILNILEEDSPQVLSLTGQGGRSSVHISRHGETVNEIAASELPGNARRVWTLKKSMNAEYDSYMVFGFDTSTLFLEVGETIEEIQDSHFIRDTNTYWVQQMGTYGIVQVTTRSVRFVNTETEKFIDWLPPRDIGGKIICASGNNRQLVVGLSSGFLIYFDIDETGRLVEDSDVRKSVRTMIENSPGNLGITNITVPSLEEGKIRTRHMAITLSDSSVCTLSLDVDKIFNLESRQTLSFEPSSILLSNLNFDESNESTTALYLHVGLKPGIVFRIAVDLVSGELQETRVRLVGSTPVYLNSVHIHGKPAVLIFSSSTCVSYLDTLTSTVKSTPILYSPLSFGTDFNSEQCPNSILGTVGDTLRILSLERQLSDESFSTKSVKLSYTPRKFIVHPQSKNLIVLASDNRVIPQKVERHLGTKYRQYRRVVVEEDENGEQITRREVIPMESSQFGHIKSLKPTDWVSKIYIVNPNNTETILDDGEEHIPPMTVVHATDLDLNETAVSVSVSVFHGHNETYLAVGTVVGLDPEFPTASSLSCRNFIRIYEINEEGNSLTFVHKTEVEEIPLALSHFQGRLLVGLGNMLRMYDLGKKQLLRKAEVRDLPAKRINGIQSQGNRVVVSDSSESISFLQYRPFNNTFILIADDTVPRHISSFTMLDYNTVCAADRFGNIFTLRLNEEISKEVDDDITGVSGKFDRRFLNGATYRLEKESDFFVGDIATGISKLSMVPNGREVIAYQTILGRIGVMIPFTKKEDIEFFQILEIHMRTHLKSLGGRDHLSYRSSFSPVKSGIDGDLCELYTQLPYTSQQKIASILEKGVKDVAKKIEDMRNRAAF